LALAWLLHHGKDGEPLPRWPFESFWRELTAERTHDRWSGVNAAVNAIYLALGEPRSRERQSTFERSSKEQARATPILSSPPQAKVPDARGD
jgi:hypothetical protein